MKPEDDYVLSRLPRRLVDRLMPFQKDGVKFAVQKKGRCLIADEMGLGKTIQAISIAWYYEAEWPLLIIVPSSLRYCWIEEIEKWLPGVHPHDINLIRSGNDASDISTSRISVVTYGLLSKQTSSIVREALTNQSFKVIICDESHYIKNARTASSKAVVPLIKNACRRILLSGTPALSKPVELFPQIDAIKPGGFGSWWQFTARYCDARTEWMGRQKLRKVDGASNLEELQSKLSTSLMIRREKHNVLKQLPPKQRQKVLFELKDSSLKKDIMSMFEDLQTVLRKNNKSTSAALNLEAATEVTEDKNRDSIERLSLISKLYQLSGEAKIGPVKEYLEMLCDNPSLKFLVFAYHHVMMNGVQQTLYDKKVKFIRIDGDTKPEDRLLYVQQYQSDPDTRVAILSILAAGVGLTFTAAKLVVFAEMYWTPGVMVQCEDRAHRIGQTAHLPVHYLVAKGTMDEWVWGAVCRKTLVTSAALTGERRHLEADKGDKYQLDVLSNAEAWVPSQDQSEMDFQTFFQSQKSNDQRSILEFFTPPSSKNKGAKRLEISGQKRSREADTKSDRQTTPHSNQSNGRILDEIVIVESDGEDFDDRPKKRKKINDKKSSSLEDSDVGCDSENLDTSVHDSQESFPKTSTEGIRNRLKQFSRSKSGGKGTKTDLGNIENKQKGQWACSVCTFLNYSELTRCEMCDTPGKGKRTKMVSDKSPNLKKYNELSRKKLNGETVSFRDDDESINENDEMDGSQTPGPTIACDDVGSCSPVFGKRKKVGHEDSGEQPVAKNPQDNKEVITKKSESDESAEHSFHFSDTEITCVEDNSEEAMVSTQSSTKRKCFQLSDQEDNSIEDEGSTRNNIDQNSINVKRACFTLDSDSDTNQKDNVQSQKLSSKDLKTIVPNKEINLETSTPLRTVTMVTGVCQSSCLTDSMMSTPVGGHDRLDIDLDPCDSPCFNLEMESSGDMSGGQFRSNDSNSSNCEADDSLPVLSRPRRRSKDTTSPDANIDTPSDSNLSACDKHNDNQSPHPGRQVKSALCFETPESVNLKSSGSSEKKKKSPDSDGKSTARRKVIRSPDIAYLSFLYTVSLHTGRVYLFDQNGESLDENFLPLDVEMGNTELLPPVLHHHGNLRLVQKFIREWNSLSETKKRLITKRGMVFHSPLVAYDQVRSGKVISTQRHKTKEDVAANALKMAESLKGSVRLISRKGPTKDSDSQESSQGNKGVLQVVNAEGIPLCLNCQSPYENTLLSKSTVTDSDTAWSTRFCSAQCMDKFWMQTNSSYNRDKVYEVEHGICQMCQFDAHSFYRKIRDTSDLKLRAQIVSDSIYSKVKSKQKEAMVRKPVEGQFWHVDHIVPVWEGGGMCDIDNMRTLCVMCHHKVTATQARKRAMVRRLQGAAAGADITAFFQKS